VLKKKKLRYNLMLFVPRVLSGSKEASLSEVKKVLEFVNGQRIAVITGAGISTESGIPDYRSPNGSYSTGHKVSSVKPIFQLYLLLSF